MTAPPPSDPPLTLRLFGPFQVSVKGKPLPRLRSRKGHWLLALLALRHGCKVEREWLLAVLWPENPPELAAHSLRNSLADLRKALGSEASRLSTSTPRTLMLDLTGARVDVLAFDEAIADGSPEALEQAIALARAPLMEGWTEEWAFQERQERELAVLGALDTLSNRALEAGDLATAERYLRLAITRDPLGERHQRALMQVLLDGGNAAAALTVYHEFRLRLRREANAEPDPETKALFEQIRTGAGWPSPTSGAPRRKPRPPGLSHNLPYRLTSFIGRESQMAEVKRLLSTSRLVTLTGAGGCGKTRLALQVATDLQPTLADGVWLVELAPLADPALVPQAVAEALRVREKPGCSLTQTLAEWLEPRHLLLVLDNCEHLVAACAHLAEALLRACPNLRILTSSREPLGIAGETPFRVPSLSLPDPQHPLTRECLSRYEATRLFVERAMTVLPSFRVTDAHAAAVARICRRLDGIPLSIELAAARVKLLAVEQIMARLDDRFRLLTGGSRTVLPRHQTLRAAIDWSYDLLSEGERVLLRRLSVFSGGWSLAAAEGICAGDGIEEWEVLELLGQLVDKSLVEAAEQQEDVRYRLLETIRQYGHEKLQASEEAMALRDQHRDWYLTMAEQAKLDLGADHGNLEAALEWSMQRGDAEAALRLGEALHGFWHPRGYMREARERLEKALSLPGAEAPTEERARALNRAGYWACRLGDYQGARELSEGALAIVRQLGIQNRHFGPLYYLGHVAMCQGDYQGARAHYEEILTILRQSGDQDNPYRAYPLNSLGDLANLEGDYEGARALSEESLEIHRQIGNRYGIAFSLKTLGDVARNQGDHEGARTLYEESLEIHRQIGNHVDTAWLLEGLAAVARAQRERKEATVLYKESLRIYHRSGEQRGIASGLEGLAGLAAADDQVERSARLFGAAEALREAIGAPLSPSDRTDYDRDVAASRAALGEEAFAAAWSAGRALSLKQAIALALHETNEA